MRTSRIASLLLLLPFGLALAAGAPGETPDPVAPAAAPIPAAENTAETEIAPAAAITPAAETTSAADIAVTNTTVRLRIAGIASVDGEIFVSVFDSKKAWLKKPARQITVAAEISSTEEPLIVELQLPAGEYAVQVFHDADGNGKMKTNFIGIPKEPTGVSNNAKGRFGPPKFGDAKFAVGTAPLDLAINMVSI